MSKAKCILAQFFKFGVRKNSQNYSDEYKTSRKLAVRHTHLIVKKWLLPNDMNYSVVSNLWYSYHFWKYLKRLNETGKMRQTNSNKKDKAVIDKISKCFKETKAITMKALTKWQIKTEANVTECFKPRWWWQ